MSMRTVIGLGLAISLSLGAYGQSTVSIPAAADTTLFQDTAGELGNGVGAHFFAGDTVRGLGARRGLIRFDIASAVPSGATITQAVLRLNCSRNNSTVDVVTLHRVLSSWGEGISDAGTPGGAGAPAEIGDATWLHRSYPTVLWGTIGGDFDPAVSASASLADGLAAVGPVVWASTPTSVANVQSWLDSPALNFGWLLLGSNISGATAHRFDTRENPTPTVRPALTITYTLPAPGACCRGSTCAVVLAGACTGPGTRFVGDGIACDAPAIFTDPCCKADHDQDGMVALADVFTFLNAWFASSTLTDIDSSGNVELADIFTFLNAWFAGC
ncbi:MAG: DNRLRE domain-containing protein [Phycisphaerales bacterium]|nr:DNRLRE domain-containing protein [Phycisphaerales bacterium]